MMFPKKDKKLHFVGIGGCGMSGVAWVLLQQGYQVSGSDPSSNTMVQRLKKSGVKIFPKQQASNIDDSIGALVISTAIREDNPEVLEARKRNIPILHRADGLKQIIESGSGVAVAGTHGKTTTTSMLSLAAEVCGLDPTILIGGELNDIGGNAKVGSSNIIIAESDESDGSFLKYQADYSIVTNIEMDHMDHYQTPEELLGAFQTFLSRTRNKNIICIDDPNIRNLYKEIKTPFKSYSTQNPEADYFAADFMETVQGISYTLYKNGMKMFPVNLGVSGRHNIANSLAALSVCDLLGADTETAAKALAKYHGVKRRFQIKGEVRGVTVVDDYAHHPTEVAATLDVAQSYVRTHEGKRVIGVFQPHRYSRTFHLGKLFGESFLGAQEVVITDVYAAGEKPIEGIDGRTVYESVVKSGHPNVQYVESKDNVVDYLHDKLDQGDLVMTMGAGDIWKVGEDLLNRLNDDKARPIPA